ncbi:zeta toxin family protein [Chitinophaga ginsengisegetis]|uniref:zeta toxin family protein n=1 Tax=Chitinophaga ginsengisegetis TaxID=393003 RepID=UPI000DBA4933|nr:zeta toxin family protein [Chitinophaga ginsengisegetis]MDR6570470.1 putative ABC-type ATPase [Chitinophaga ginsengisegetis]MDR6650204.1 putative ABC-type ATPase [Chitinophaga ginsengisegetis]MDR6656677.1 putative ABC-type ATPase [Chitinophaga ginsengisegetis]
MPTLYIIAGSNGAGKSSAGPDLLPTELIKKHSPFDGDKLKSLKQLEFRKQLGCSYKEAGKLADEYVDQTFELQYKSALEQNEDFVYEGHFTEEESWSLIRTFKKEKYRINMLFMGLATLEISLDRVFKRAMNGGHNVPVYEIEKNYYGNLYKLNQHFKLIDDLIILDSSEELVLHLATQKDNLITFHIPPDEMPLWFTAGLPNLFQSGSFT